MDQTCLRAGLQEEAPGWAGSSLRVGLQQSAGWLCAYFWAGIMSSMDWPFSSFFSISTMSFTPSTTSCTFVLPGRAQPVGVGHVEHWSPRQPNPPPAGGRRQGLRSRQKCLSGAWNVGLPG